MQPGLTDETTMVSLAAADVARYFPMVDRPHIDAMVRSCVHGWCERARVKTFVAIFAARDARAALERELATDTAA